MTSDRLIDRKTPAQKRDEKDASLASAIRIAADALLYQIEQAKGAGLDVDCNVGTRYSHSIGGYVKIYRPFKNKAMKVTDIELVQRKKP